jgi:endonuclease/exonuclease/phosphatase family metal-dependent hydrolase
VRTSALVGTLVMGVTLAVAAQSGPSAQGPRRPRIIAELSDLLTHTPLAPCPPAPSEVATPRRSRVASWNIKAARSAPVGALVAEMRAMAADVIALQEVDVRTRRAGFVDQPVALATALGFHYVFAASILWDEGHYGLALLSRWPLARVTRHRIGGADLGEPRIVLDVTICAGGRPVRVLNHHADRRIAARAIGFADVQQITNAALGRGVLLLGDLNEYPDGPGVRALVGTGLVDLRPKGANTTSAGRVDYVLADGPLARRASAVHVWPTDKSDHHAVLVDFEW